MAKVYRKIVIKETSEFMRTTYGFMYDVQVWASIDNENFHYCGIGKYVKSITEATAWIENYTK